MKKITLFFLMLLLAYIAEAQNYYDYFTNATLRLDYIFAGDSKHQDIYFHEASSYPQWAGRKNRLSEKYMNGNGQITVRDQATKQVIYVSTFSTLFQEWQIEEEATRLRKSFENSYIVPFPLKPIEVTITLTDTHMKVTSELTHVVDPKDILIRNVKQNDFESEYVLKSGDLASCVDIAILSEGYTEGEMDKFMNDCQRAVDALFSHEPFKSMKSRFNVIAVKCPSKDSGPCIPGESKWQRTSFDIHYSTFYVDRYLMTSKMWKVYDALDCIPFEHIIVMVNSSTYGGGGIYNQIMVTTSDHSTFKEVLVHEFGHSYGGLGDEYDYGDQAETAYPADTEPWEPNLTTLVDFDSKWKDMLPADTPIPTPKVESDRFFVNKEKANELSQKVGVFEGGGYQTTGVYRPAQECRMKINEVDNFCPVCYRALVRITDFYTGK